MNESMNIGQVAKAAGVSAKMIRHYERIGLLPQAERNDSGYRLYRERDVSLLRFIRQSRSLGFSVPQIADGATSHARTRLIASQAALCRGTRALSVSPRVAFAGPAGGAHRRRDAAKDVRSSP